MKADEKLYVEAGQRIAAGFEGTTVTDEIKEAVKRAKIGNIILFSRNVESLEQVRNLTGELDELILSETGNHPFIMIDQEGGAMSRLPSSFPNAPTAEALGVLGDEAKAEECAYLTAMVLRSMGVNFNLAPSVDVNTASNNPVIGVRSFGADSSLVARLGLATVKGYRRAGIKCSIKHFPGHGDTKEDTHYQLPKVSRSNSEIRDHIYPFKHIIHNSDAAVMSSHIIFPELDQNLPSTLSRRIIHDYLRVMLFHKGLVLSDCLEMDAVRSSWGIPKAILKAFDASIDIALISHHPALAEVAVQSAVNGYLLGNLDHEEWRESLDRIKSEKAALNTIPVTSCDFSSVKSNLDEISTSLIKVEGAPFKPTGNSVFIGPGDIGVSNIGEMPKDFTFSGFLAQRFEGFGIDYPCQLSDKELVWIITEAAKADNIYLGVYSAYSSPSVRKLIERLSVLKKRICLISLLSPVDIKLFSAFASSSILTYEYSLRAMEKISSVLDNGV